VAIFIHVKTTMSTTSLLLRIRKPCYLAGAILIFHFCISEMYFYRSVEELMCLNLAISVYFWFLTIVNISMFNTVDLIEDKKIHF